MKLSKKCEYSILVLIELSRLYDDGTVASASYLSGQNEIPRKFLEQIMNFLRKSGYVQSIRGASGGYRLTRSPDEINLAEIIRMIDGAIAPVASVSEFFYQQTPSQRNDKLILCFQEIRNYTVKKLEETTFNQLM